MKKYNLYFDGGCIPNPNGVASLGFHCPELDLQHHEVVGDGEGMTNNIAEWSAVCKGVQVMKEELSEGDTLIISGDSQLVIKQLKGEYRVKKPHLKEIFEKTMSHINDLLIRPIKIEYQWIPRNENTIADRLAFKSLKDFYIEKGHPICDCGGIMIQRDGKYGKFWGCSHYPKCRKTRSIN